MRHKVNHIRRVNHRYNTFLTRFTARRMRHTPNLQNYLHKYPICIIIGYAWLDTSEHKIAKQAVTEHIQLSRALVNCHKRTAAVNSISLSHSAHYETSKIGAQEQNNSPSERMFTDWYSPEMAKTLPPLGKQKRASHEINTTMV